MPLMVAELMAAPPHNQLVVEPAPPELYSELKLLLPCAQPYTLESLMP